MKNKANVVKKTQTAKRNRGKVAENNVFFRTFAVVMNENIWTENVIIANADFIDRVAFDLIVNFERMLGRRIPQADLPQWLDCIALDGGLREGDHETQVVLIRTAQHRKLENFIPADYDKEINGKAFRDSLGEFALTVYEEPSAQLLAGTDYFCDVVQTVCMQPAVKRVMVVPSEPQYNNVRARLQQLDDTLTAQGEVGLGQKRITLFAMQPMPTGPYRQEILGYSLMAALGIRSEEISRKAD